MLTLLLTTALATTKFTGGSPNDFAAVLAGAAKQNVVVEQGEGQVIRPCEFDTSDLTGLARAIRAQTQMTILPGSDLILSDGLLARQLVERPAQEVQSDSEVLISVAVRATPPSPQDARLAFQPLNMAKTGLPAGAVQNGRVTLQTTKNEGLDLASLSGQLSKPVTIHWLLKDSVVCCQVASMPEDLFLTWVAKSVGGRLVSTPKDYTLDIDATEIRKRAVNTITRQVSVGNAADVTMQERVKAFRLASLNSLNVTQIKTALATDGGETKIVLNAQNPMSRTALAYVQDMERLQQQSGNRNQRRGGGNALRQMDTTRPAYLVVDSKFNAFVEIPIRGGRGSGGVVRI